MLCLLNARKRKAEAVGLRPFFVDIDKPMTREINLAVLSLWGLFLSVVDFVDEPLSS